MHKPAPGKLNQQNTMSTRASSINRALDEIGDKWCLLILQQVFLGIHGFNEILQATGISRGVLSDRLQWLQSKACLKRQQKTPGAGRHSYHLTLKSKDLYANALMALVWEKKFFPCAALDSINLTHTLCQQGFWPQLRCSDCNREVVAPEVEFYPGPGATRDTRLKKVRRRSSSPMSAGTGQTPYTNLIKLVGDRWTANIIALAFHGLHRFEQFNKELPIATNILSDRLGFLVEENILLPQAYQHNPLRHEYHLSPKGSALLPWFLTLLQWGDRWCDPERLGKPMLLIHARCRQPLLAQVVCGTCQQELEPHEVQLTLTG